MDEGMARDLDATDYALRDDTQEYDWCDLCERYHGAHDELHSQAAEEARRG